MACIERDEEATSEETNEEEKEEKGEFNTAENQLYNALAHYEETVNQHRPGRNEGGLR